MVILLVFGIICFLVGVGSLRQAREHFKDGQETEAEVVAIEETSWTGTDTRLIRGYHAIYSYRDQAGNEHRLPGNRKSTSKGRFKLGERKTVVYNPNSPSEVLDERAKVYAGSVFYLVVAAGMIAFGTAGIVLDW